MLATLLLTALSLAPAAQDKKTEPKSPTAKVDLFAAEDFYKKQAGKEQEFTGQLARVQRDKNVAGFGRFNPHRLIVIVHVEVTVEVEQGGKKTTEKRFVPEQRTYEVYIAG